MFPDTLALARNIGFLNMLALRWSGLDPDYSDFTARVTEKLDQAFELGPIGDAVFADKLNHASLNDAALLSRADFIRYQHAPDGCPGQDRNARKHGLTVSRRQRAEGPPLLPWRGLADDRDRNYDDSGSGRL